MLYPIVNKHRSIISLDGEWEFRFLGGDVWQSIYVPASFNNQITDPRALRYSGIVEYRRSFTVPTLFSNERKILRFDSVTHNAQVIIDDTLSYSHQGGFLPFEIDITALECGCRHSLLVRVDNRVNYHTFPIGNEIGIAFFGSDNPGIPSVENGKKKLQGENQANFDFFNYAGITRSVRIYTTPVEFIKDIKINTKIDNNDGLVYYKITGASSNVQVFNKDEISVGSNKENEEVIKINDASFWSPDNPYLYTLHVESNSDSYELPFGIREIAVKDNKLLLNNKPIYLKGVGKHEDSFIRGRGKDECLNTKDINLLHWLGANSIRTSHYPYAEEMYSLCDREGILIIDELPTVGLNFQGAINPYKLDNYGYHEELLKSLIDRDSNHPSVIMWSLGNEPDLEHFPLDAYNYWHSLYKNAHTLDQQNRPVTVVAPQNDYTKDITTKTMDVVLINRYYGWYNLSGNLKVASEALEEELSFWKEINKPLVLSEYGADAISGMHGINGEMFTEEFQAEYLKAMNEVLDKFDFVAGEHPWNFADFDTQEGPMRAGGNHKGLFSRDRKPKMAAYVIRERWKTKGFNLGVYR